MREEAKHPEFGMKESRLRARKIILLGLLAAFLVTIPVACKSFRFGLKGVDTPTGDFEELTVVVEGLDPEEKQEFSTRACEVCRAILNFRDYARRMANTSQPNQGKSFWEGTADHYDRLVERCTQVHTLTGQCPSQP